MSELRLERVYEIDGPSLFSYLTEARHLVQWWGPEGARVLEARLDLARPGPWSITIETPRGPYEMCGIVLRVEPGRLVEFSMDVPGQAATGGTVTFEIVAEGQGRTRLILVQTGLSDEAVEMGKRGWGGTLGRLDRLLGVAA